MFVRLDIYLARIRLKEVADFRPVFDLFSSSSSLFDQDVYLETKFVLAY
jgi:hypothetical protein